MSFTCSDHKVKCILLLKWDQTQTHHDLKTYFNSQPPRMMFITVLFLIQYFAYFLEHLQHAYG